MLTHVQVAFRNMESIRPLADRIRGEVERMDDRFGPIHAGSVVLDMPHRRHRGEGNRYHVRIVMEVPGRTIAVTRDSEANDGHEALSLAVKDALDEARRRLEAYAHKGHRRP
ncbi:MAG: HPF/RaiA family ribosome-associated protein [Isosphaeraceae bacterium]